MNKAAVRRLLKVFCILLGVLLFPGVLLIESLKLPPVYKETYYGELADMYERLRETPSPRLVIIGGSNVAFGLDVSQLQEELSEGGCPYTVCSFGLYGAIGTSVMLELAAPLLREGDLAVLCMEPVSEAHSTYFGAAAYLKSAETDPGLLWPLSLQKKGALLGSLVGVLQDRYNAVSTNTMPSADGVYARSSFDESCSMTCDRPGNIMALGFDTADPVDLAGLTVEEDFALQVRSFAGQAAARGARAVLGCAPVNRSALTEESDAAVQKYYTTLTSAYGLPVISDPNDYILDAGWFYDNNFHLNTPGSKLRTHLLACDILFFEGIYREPDFAEPVMPDFVKTGQRSTAQAAEGYFLTEALSSDACRIIGLTDLGRGQSSLTVPAVMEGRQVVGFTSEAFEGCKASELTLPETVESLPDGAFASTGITRLVLLHEHSVPSVSARTFAGADSLRVYVPAAAYSLYRDGAGCEGNPWQDYRDRIFPY